MKWVLESPHPMNVYQVKLGKTASYERCIILTSAGPQDFFLRRVCQGLFLSNLISEIPIR